MTEVHPDPIGDSGQKAAQYVQLLAMAAEALAVIAGARARAAAERDQAKADSINDQLLVNHKVAADLWQPVLADHKRDKLDVAQTLTAWSAAQAWRETDPDADRASNLAEERLHDLRPSAMTRYDDLRNEGLDPVTAMRQVVPLLENNARVGEAAPLRAALSQTDTAAHVEDSSRTVQTNAEDQTLYAEPEPELRGEVDRIIARYAIETDADRQDSLIYQFDNVMRTNFGHDWADRDDQPAANTLQRDWMTATLGRDRPEALDDGRMPDTAQTRDLADELNEEHDGYEPPYGLSGYELKYGVQDRMADWPHRGFDDDPTMPTVSSEATVLDATTVLTIETVLLAEMEAHRDAAAHATSTAETQAHTADELAAVPDDLRTPRIDEHAEAVTQAQPHVAAGEAAATTATFERSAEHAIAASYPQALTDISAVSAAAGANAQHPQVDLSATLAAKQPANVRTGPTRS